MNHVQLAMLALVATLALALSPGCASVGSGGVDLERLAQQVELVRLDVADLAPLATPATQERLAQLDKAVAKVEDALLAAAKGGPISGVTSAARAALAVADQVVLELQANGQYVGDWPLYLGLAKVALRHISIGDNEAASSELAPIPEQK